MLFLNQWSFTGKSLALASIVSIFSISLGFVFVMIVDGHGMEEFRLNMIEVESLNPPPPPPPPPMISTT